METSRNEQLMSYKLCPVLSSVMKSHAVPLQPPWDVGPVSCPVVTSRGGRGRAEGDVWREDTPMTFITGHCDHCSIVLLVIVVNSSGCPIYELNSVPTLHIQENTENEEGSVLSLVSGIHWGSWNVSPSGKRGYSIWNEGNKGDPRSMLIYQFQLKTHSHSNYCGKIH